MTGLGSKRFILLVFLLAIGIAASIALHECVHIIQSSADWRVEFVTVRVFPNYFAVATTYSNWSGNETDQDRYEYLSELPYREAQAYGLQFLFILSYFWFVIEKITTSNKK